MHYILVEFLVVGLLVYGTILLGETNLSETIRKSPLVEDQNALGKQKIRPRTIFNMATVRHLEFHGTNNGFFQKPM